MTEFEDAAVVAVAPPRAPLFLFVGRRRVEHAADSCFASFFCSLASPLSSSCRGLFGQRRAELRDDVWAAFEDGHLGRRPRDHLPVRRGLSTFLSVRAGLHAFEGICVHSDLLS